MPLFSVIIPTYNRANLIGRTLETVVAQDYSREDFEVIIVDDGSTDELAATLAKYHGLVKLLRQENRGPGAARNRGLKEATGKYIAFLDSDDLWFPWTLELFAGVIRETDAPAILMGVPEFFNDEARLTGVRSGAARYRRYGDFFSAKNRSVLCGAGSGIFRADHLREVGGFVEQNINAEDLDLMLRLGLAPGFVQLDAPLTFGYRRHAFSSSAEIHKSYFGLCHIHARERAGVYPGGQAHRSQRLDLITSHMRATVARLAQAGRYGMSADLYLKGFGWNVSRRRWFFLAGMPVYGMACLLHLRR